MKKINVSDDYQLSKVQDNVSEALNALPFDYPIIKGNFVQTQINTSDTAVNHKLSKPITGFIVVRRDANALIWESSTQNSRPQDQVILRASASVNVTLFFF